MSVFFEIIFYVRLCFSKNTNPFFLSATTWLRTYAALVSAVLSINYCQAVYIRVSVRLFEIFYHLSLKWNFFSRVGIEEIEIEIFDENVSRRKIVTFYWMKRSTTSKMIERRRSAHSKNVKAITVIRTTSI